MIRTRVAMRGGCSFRDALAKRLELIQPTVPMVTDYLKLHPPRLTPGIKWVLQFFRYVSWCIKITHAFCAIMTINLFDRVLFTIHPKKGNSWKSFTHAKLMFIWYQVVSIRWSSRLRKNLESRSKTFLLIESSSFLTVSDNKRELKRVIALKKGTRYAWEKNMR